MASGRTLDQVAASLRPSPVGAATSGAGGSDIVSSLDPERPTLRPKLIWFNFGLTVALLALLGLDVLPLALVFVGATAIALVVNLPKQQDQLTAIKSHATAIVSVVAMVFAAAVLVGVLSGTGMVTAMAHGIVAAVPEPLGPWFAVITGLLSMPLTFLLTNDAFYFGILPILTEAAGHYGIAPDEPARAGTAAAGVAGPGQPGRPPQEGHLAIRGLLTGDARHRDRAGLHPRWAASSHSCSAARSPSPCTRSSRSSACGGWSTGSAPGVRHLAMGGVDLQRDLNAGNGNLHTLYVRSHLVVVSRAAGIEPPVDAVWPYLGDEAGLREQAEFARLLGSPASRPSTRVSRRSCTRCSHLPGGSWIGRGRSLTPSTPPAARRCGCPTVSSSTCPSRNAGPAPARARRRPVHRRWREVIRGLDKFDR